MQNKQRFKFLLFFFLTGFWGVAQEFVTWNTYFKKENDSLYTLYFEATIEPKWHLYSQFLPEGGALPTEFVFENESEAFTLEGTVKESKSITAYDSVFEMGLTYFEETALFSQQIKVPNTSDLRISGEINYQACDDKLCIFRSQPFEFLLGSDAKATEKLSIDKRSAALSELLQLPLKRTAYLEESRVSKASGGSLWNLFFLGLIGGLLAFLTPCVFPMVPLTVSYFLKQSANRSKGIANALLYGFFIIFIYGLLSLPFHFLDALDPGILNTIATNVVLNTVFFFIFLFFAFSFFGYYELTLPSKWGTQSDAASNRQGIIGIFFMALTLAIVSFSCTGPILGSLLAGSLSAESGALQLTIGMLGFGVALGLPFALFALFPNSLNALPKSGGWMNTVKVVLGFLELGLALKFLSNADLVGHWGLLKREVFVGIWLLLSFALTLYLFGFFKFPHESKSKIGWMRKIVAGVALLFTSYLLLGLTASENRLKLLSGFPPPEFYSLREQQTDCPLNLECYKDFETGREVALRKNKPILLDFTGWACVNCRKMEENVWSTPKIYQLLKEHYILISLYVDDRKTLPEEKQFNFEYQGNIKKINTVGDLWATFQWMNFQTASQPFYVQMMADGTLLNAPIQYTDAAAYQSWLEEGLEGFEQ